MLFLKNKISRGEKERISESNGAASSPSSSPSPTEIKSPQTRKRRCLCISLAVLLIVLILAIALGVGLGVGLSRARHNASSSTATSADPSASSNSTPTVGVNSSSNPGSFWLPTAGTAWQIELLNPISNTSVDVPVYDIDLFSNSADAIAGLHGQGRKVICYFSAGSYEDWRPDKEMFNRTTDLGAPLQGWPGEWWVNTKSANVRAIMEARMDQAVQKKCDAIDPDNIDEYNNQGGGLGLTQDDAVDYVSFLADAAHSRGMAAGLKNGGEVVTRVLDKVQFEVNEQCVKNKECDGLQPFVKQGKPVFHIEYPDEAPDISAESVVESCGGSGTSGGADGFSSVLKKMQLDDWVVECPK